MLRNSLTIDLSTAETVAVLEKQKHLPKTIRSDHGSQFKEQWKGWCKERGVEAHFAHPFYPQGMGKVVGRTMHSKPQRRKSVSSYALRV